MPKMGSTNKTCKKRAANYLKYSSCQSSTVPGSHFQPVKELNPQEHRLLYATKMFKHMGGGVAVTPLVPPRLSDTYGTPETPQFPLQVDFRILGFKKQPTLQEIKQKLNGTVLTEGISLPGVDARFKDLRYFENNKDFLIDTAVSGVAVNACSNNSLGANNKEPTTPQPLTMANITLKDYLCSFCEDSPIADIDYTKCKQQSQLLCSSINNQLQQHQANLLTFEKSFEEYSSTKLQPQTSSGLSLFLSPQHQVSLLPCQHAPYQPTQLPMCVQQSSFKNPDSVNKRNLFFTLVPQEKRVLNTALTGLQDIKKQITKVLSTNKKIKRLQTTTVYTEKTLVCSLCRKRFHEPHHMKIHFARKHTVQEICGSRNKLLQKSNR